MEAPTAQAIDWGLLTPSINTIFNSFTPFASEQLSTRMSTLMVGTQQGHKN
jgi:hypothetical protein